MAKDYGRRRPAVRRSNAPKRFFGILASFLFGYLAATVFDFTSLSSWVNANILSKHKGQQPLLQAKAKEPELPKPNFEFYTLLAKDGHRLTAVINKPQLIAQVKPVLPPQALVATTKSPVTVTLQPTAKLVPVTEGKPITLANSDKDSYLIQLAAFKNKQDAEHMKAALTLKGFDVKVIATSQQQGSWFRVIAGPFNSRAIAEKTQLGLAQNERIRGIIRKANA
ncbi:MAG: SPOR domain-containing protein [Tatlockia sp.]|nr:SPOR domain-containing protein [Tatlockia sp.]